MPVWLDPVFPWWIVFDGQSNLRECPSAGHDPDWMKMCWIYLDIAWYSIVIWTGVSWPQCPSFQWMNSSNHPSHGPIWSRISRRRRVTSFSMRYTSKSPSAWCYLSSGSNNKPKEYPQQPQKNANFTTSETCVIMAQPFLLWRPGALGAITAQTLNENHL